MDLKLEVYTLELDLLGMVEKYHAVMYEERAFTAGSFTLSCPLTPENQALLQPDHILWFRESAAGVIEAIEESAGEGGPEITVKGPMLTGLLARRILWGRFDLSGKPAALMARLVSSCLLEPVGGPTEERKASGLALAPVPEEAAPAIRKQKTGGTLLEALEELGEANNVAFGIALDASVPQMVFWTRPGTDRTVGQAQNEPVFFSTELDDVLSSEYSYNSGGYCNTALVAGEGEGEERVYVAVDEDGGESSGPSPAPFIPKGETVAMLTADGREMTVFPTGDGGYTSAYTGPQIDLAVGKVLSGELAGEPGQGVPAGGAAGQILAKKSAADYDTVWVDAPTGSGSAAGVASFNGRTGAVVPKAGDYTAGMVGALPDSTKIPSKTSQLSNDSGFATKSEMDAAIQQAVLKSWEASY